MIGFIGRLDYQKGIDIILSATPELLQDDVQFVMLGSGEKQYEEWMRVNESAFKDKYRGWVGFNVPISHRITAGCDILLMPSRFEPCGLNQLYAMRYGTIPVAPGTGGLIDTVKTFNPYAQEGSGEGTGLVNVLQLALSIKPTLSQSLNNLGVVYTMQDKMDAAANMIEKAIVANPTIRRSI